MAIRSVIRGVVAILLFSAPVRAEEPRACRTFRDCAALAEREPSQFSRTLALSLRGLPASVLVAGLDWTHARPAVAERAHLQAEEALRFAAGHSITSARKLLNHAANRPNDTLKLEWLHSLARDPKGRQVLGAFIDEQPASPLWLFASMAYVQQFSRHDALRSKAGRRELRVRADRCADMLWKRYLAVRQLPAPKALSVSDAAWLGGHVLYAEAYQERLRALVESEISEGRAPVVRELASLASHRRGDHAFASRLVSWTESPNRLLRRQALDVLLRDLDRWKVTTEERGRIRRSLLAADADGDYAPFESVSAALLELMDVAPAEETDRMLQVAQREVGISALKLIAVIAERLPARRSLVAAKFDAPEYGTTEVLTNVLRATRLPGLQAALVRWFLDLKPDTLWDERLQERILVLVRALPVETDPDAPFPPSRRPTLTGNERRLPSLSCEEIEDEDEDRKAFELPPREEPHPEAVAEIVAAAPLTSEERTERWKAFVLAVEQLQGKLRTSDEGP